MPAGRWPTRRARAGGEASAASAFVVEYAPAGAARLVRRVDPGDGLGAGIGAATLLTWRMPPATLASGGWRLAFLAAVPVGLVGLYLRLRLDETPRFHAVKRAQAVARSPVRDAIRAYPGRMLVGFGLVAAVSLSFCTFFIFLPSHLSTELGIPLPRALAGALLGLAVMVALAPALGRLSDRVGRKPLLAAVTLSLLGLTVPIYLLIRQGGPVGRGSGTSWSGWS